MPPAFLNAFYAADESNWPTVSELREAIAGVNHADRANWSPVRPRQPQWFFAKRARLARMKIKPLSSACAKQQHYHCAKLACSCGCHRGGQK